MRKEGRGILEKWKQKQKGILIKYWSFIRTKYIIYSVLTVELNKFLTYINYPEIQAKHPLSHRWKPTIRTMFIEVDFCFQYTISMKIIKILTGLTGAVKRRRHNSSVWWYQHKTGQNCLREWCSRKFQAKCPFSM